MKKSLIVLIIALLSLSSCKKDAEDNINKIVTTQLSDKVYESQYTSKHTNGDFYILGQGAYSLDAQGVAHKLNSLVIYGSFYNQLDSILPGGDVIIDTFHFSGASSYDIQEGTIDNSFYGRNIQVMLTPPAGQAPQFSAQLYLPENLFAQVGSSSANIFNPVGDTLIWNADPANKNGMIITFDYNPNSYLNNGTLFSKDISESIYGIPDNGSYIIPSYFLPLFSSGVYINITVTRDATSLVSYNQFKYILHSSVSTVVFNFKTP